IAAQIDDPPAQAALPALLQNPEHVVGNRCIGELAHLQVADRRVWDLSANDLVNLNGRAFDRELERIRRIQPRYLNTHRGPWLATDQRRHVTNCLATDVLPVDGD